jgi:carbon monoxide dehydrogenase subunit G
VLHMEGDKQFRQSPEELFARLTDLGFVLTCLPDVTEVKSVEAGRARATVRPSFAFVKGTLELTIEKLEELPPVSARLLFRNKGIGSSAEVEASFSLSATAEGTQLHWVGKLHSLGGLLKLVPKGLIQGAAQKVVADMLDRIERQIS